MKVPAIARRPCNIKYFGSVSFATNEQNERNKEDRMYIVESNELNKTN